MKKYQEQALGIFFISQYNLSIFIVYIDNRIFPRS